MAVDVSWCATTTIVNGRILQGFIRKHDQSQFATLHFREAIFRANSQRIIFSAKSWKILIGLILSFKFKFVFCNWRKSNFDNHDFECKLKLIAVWLIVWFIRSSEVVRSCPIFFLYFDMPPKNKDFFQKVHRAVFIFEHTCPYAQWAHMHRFLSIRLSVTRPKFTRS